MHLIELQFRQGTLSQNIYIIKVPRSKAALVSKAVQ